MGVPTSEAGYTSAMPRREDHEVHKRTCGGNGKKNYIYIYIYWVSQEECARLRESVPYVKVYRYNPKHLYLKLNGYGDNGQRSLKL